MAFACVYIPEFSVQAVLRNERVFSRSLAVDATRGRTREKGKARQSSTTRSLYSNGPYRALLRGTTLRKSGSALALLDGTPPQCRVVAANEAALRVGIEISMAKAQAEQFGSIVEIRRRSPEQEKNAHAALLDLGASFSPRVQDTAPESLVLDLAGLEALFGSDEQIARLLVERARGLGLEARVAVASNPDTALHAARGQSQITVIRAGEEAARLGPLPISVLGPSAEALKTLQRWGVRTCAALAALPVLDLSERLGAEGVRLHEWARGAVNRSLVLAETPLSFEEELTLDYEVTEIEPLSFLLSRLIESLCARLEARSLAAAALQLRLKLARHEERPSYKEGGIPRSARNDIATGVADPDWFVKVLSLPVPMRNAKLLLNLLRLQLQNDPPGAPVCGVYLSAEPAHPRATQGGFFLPTGPDPEKLELTLARLAHMVSESRVGSPEVLDTHRPDAFRMRRFAPRQKTSTQAQTKPDRQECLCQQMNLAGFRNFRPPLPARVEIREGRPAKVFFRGLRGGVVAASGPWCASGDWWTKDFWQQEEWDLEIMFAVDTKTANQQYRHSEEFACGSRRSDEESAFLPHSKSRFLAAWAASRKRDDQSQPAASLGMTGWSRSAEELKVVQRTGLYRFAYDPVRDIWIVRGMFD